MVGDLEHRGRRDRLDLVLVGLMVAMTLLLVVAAVGGVAEDPWFFRLLAAGSVVSLLGFLTVRGRPVRSARGRPDGVELASGRSVRLVPWTSVVRVRGTDLRGFPSFDEHLELVDGELAPLPAQLPRGTVERWRAAVGGGTPGPDEHPRSWTVPRRPVDTLAVFLHVPLIGCSVTGPLLGYAVAGAAVCLVVQVVLVATVLWSWSRRPLRYEATAAGLCVRGTWRSRLVPWDRVVGVGPRDGGWDGADGVLQLDDGGRVDLPRGLDAAVVDRWRHQTAPR